MHLLIVILFTRISSVVCKVCDNNGSFVHGKHVSTHTRHVICYGTNKISLVSPINPTKFYNCSLAIICFIFIILISLTPCKAKNYQQQEIHFERE